MLIAAWGGLRYGELTELRRSDITVTDSTVLVSVTRALVHVAGSGFRIGPPKSAAGVRVVALPLTVRSAIVGHLVEHVGPEPDAMLFPSERGYHLAQSTFARSWYPGRKAAGRKDMPWHALRHFAGTRYTQTGATLRESDAPRALDSGRGDAVPGGHWSGRRPRGPNDRGLTARQCPATLRTWRGTWMHYWLDSNR